MGDIAVDDADGTMAVDQDALEAHLRALHVHDFDGAHRVYQKNATLKIPQQNVTIVGRDNIKEARRKQAGRELLAVDVIIGQSNLWMAECVFNDAGRKTLVVSIMSFCEGQIVQEREYICEFSPTGQ